MQVIQSPDFPGNPLPNPFQFINIFPVLRRLKQGSLFQMLTNKCWGEGHDHSHEFAVYPIISTAQDIFGFFSCQCTLLHHVLLAVYQNPRSFSIELLPNCAVFRFYCCHQLFLPMCRVSHLPLMNFLGFLLAHSSSLSRSLCKATLSSSVIDRSSQFGVPWKCECTLLLLILQ